MKLDEHFSGLRKHRGSSYFNVELQERVSCSLVFVQITRIAGASKPIKGVEPNGLCRLAIYL